MENLCEDSSFKCEFCEKAFPTKAKLERHTKTHDDKKFKCFCGSAFPLNGYLKKHQKRMHPSSFSPQMQQSGQNSSPRVSEVLYPAGQADPLLAQTISPSKATVTSLLGQPITSTPKKSKYSPSSKTFKKPAQLSPSKATPVTIDKHSSESKPETEVEQGFKLGDRVSTTGSKNGILRYIGEVDFASGKWAGIQLDRPIGKNDGSYKDKRYFHCPPKHGLFVTLKSLKKVHTQVTTVTSEIQRGETHDLSGSQSVEQIASGNKTSLPSLKRKQSIEQGVQLTTSSAAKIKKKTTGDDLIILQLQQEELKKKLKKVDSEKIRLEKKLIQAKATAKIAESSKHKQEREKEKLMEDYNLLNQKLENARVGESRELQKNTELQKQIRTLESEKNVFYEEIQKAKKEKQTAEENLHKAEANLDQAKTTMLKQLQDLGQEKDALTRDKYELEKRNRIMSSEIDVLKMENARLKREEGTANEKLEKELQVLRNENEDLKRRREGSVSKTTIPSRQYSATILSTGSFEPKMYCDICDISNVHETEDCPKQISDSPLPEVEDDEDNMLVCGIPEPVETPKLTSLSQIDDLPMVYFDLETTGLSRHSHITQLSARNTAGQIFDRYVKPKVPISTGAVTISRNRIIDGQFYHKDKPVLAITISQALREFFYFIGDSPVLLVGHNIKIFDCHVLLNAVTACGMLKMFETRTAGFLDTLSLFRSMGVKPPYKQEKLYERLIGGTYEAHDACEDVKALQKLINAVSPLLENKLNATFDLAYVKAIKKFKEDARRNMVKWQRLIEKNVISKGLAKKAAESGLIPRHLKFSYDGGG